MSKYIYSGTMEIGYDRRVQEDFLNCWEFDDGSVITIIADGFGSLRDGLQPAVMAVSSVMEDIKHYMENEPELFKKNTEFFIKKALLNANSFMGALKLADENKYSGYGCAMTAAYFSDDKKITVAHAGYTRLYCLRDGKLAQLTKDHTVAQEYFEKGDIDYDTYHTHPSRLKLTSGIGHVFNPEIITFKTKIKENDIIIMTTDGIHCAITKNSITEIVLNSGSFEEASKNLTDAARNIVKYPDNGTCVLIALKK